MPMRRLEENEAAKILRQIFGGSVHWRDVPGAPPGTHDFDIVCPDGITIAVEVTRITDPVVLAFWTAHSKEKWEAPTLSKSWLLDVDPKASVRALKGRVEPLLHQLEAAGMTWFSTASDHVAAKELQQLGARWGHALEVNPPYIGICHVPYYWVNAEDLRGEVEKVAWKSDNRHKLGRAYTAAKRHLFIWVDPLAHLVVGALFYMERIKPPSGCDLPPEVDVLWIGRRESETLWRFDRRGGWRKVR